MEEQKEKLVQIEPLPVPEVKQSKPKGRPRLTEEQKVQKRIAKGLPPTKDQVQLTKGRKKALEKARIVKSLKAEYRHTEDNERKEKLAVQINAIPFNRNPIPLANADLKQKIKYQNPAYSEEGIEPSLLDQNPTLINTAEPKSDNLYQWSNSQQGQQLWSNKLQQLETKMNNLDNYLSKIRVLSGEGTAGDYGNPANVKQNHYIIPHNQHINPHHGPTDPSPFVPSFKSRVMASSSLKRS